MADHKQAAMPGCSLRDLSHRQLLKKEKKDQGWVESDLQTGSNTSSSPTALPGSNVSATKHLDL